MLRGFRPHHERMCDCKAMKEVVSQVKSIIQETFQEVRLQWLSGGGALTRTDTHTASQVGHTGGCTVYTVRYTKKDDRGFRLKFQDFKDLHSK